MGEFYVFPYLNGSLGRCLFQVYYAKYYSEVTGLELTYLSQNDCENLELLARLFTNLKNIQTPENYETLTYPEDSNQSRHPISTTITSHIQLRGTPMRYEYCSHTNLFPNWKNALGPASIQIIVDVNLVNYESQKNTWMIHFKEGERLDGYYASCIDEIPDGKRLHVFGKNSDYSRSMVGNLTKGRNLQVTYSNQELPVAALYEMGFCLGGFIGSNSTLSWWGAFYARKRALDFGHKMPIYYPASCMVIPEWGKKISNDLT